MTGKVERQNPRRRGLSRKLAALSGAVAIAVLTGCSAEGARLGLPAPATAEAPWVGNLWLGAWIASLVVGVLVWGLIGWAVLRYRRRVGDSPAPRQTKYHLPLELLYTLVPFLIIGVLFYYTVQAQDAMTKQEGDPEVVINVIGQKWSWTFNYMEADNPAIGTDAYRAGSIEDIPELVLPVGKKVRFNLLSADVIHSFWVPSFYFKLDVIPGHPNSFDATPTAKGTYDGKCAELCGAYHAEMLFKVRVVDEASYNEYVKSLAASGDTDRSRGKGHVKLPASMVDTIPTKAAEQEQS